MMNNGRESRHSSFIVHHPSLFPSMPRITRIAGSLAIVVIAYWAYALLAVPLDRAAGRSARRCRGSPTTERERAKNRRGAAKAASRALSPGRTGN